MTSIRRALPVRSDLEHVGRYRWHEHDERPPEQRVHERHQDQKEDHGLAADVTQPIGQRLQRVAPGFRAAGDANQRHRPSHAKHRPGRDEQRNRDAFDFRSSDGNHDDAGDSRTHDSGRLPYRCVERYGAQHCRAVDKVRIVGGPRRAVEGPDSAGNDRHDQDMPHLHSADLRQYRQREHRNADGALRRDDELALVEPVGEHTADYAEDNGRNRVRDAQYAKILHGAGQLVNQQELYEREYLLPKDGKQKAEPVDPVLGIAHGGRNPPCVVYPRSHFTISTR